MSCIQMDSSVNEHLHAEEFDLSATLPAPDLDDRAIASFLDLLLDVFAETLQADRVSILLTHPLSQSLSIEAARGMPEDIIRSARVHPGEGIVGLAVQERIPMLIRADEKPDYLRVPLNRPELTASIVIPIYHEEFSLGAICASTSSNPLHFSSRNLDWMIEVSNRLSPVLLALQMHKRRSKAVTHLSHLLEVIDQMAQIDREDKAVELTLRAATELSNRSNCFYLALLEEGQFSPLASRRELEPISKWSKITLDFFEELGRQVQAELKEADAIVELRASYEVRQAFKALNIERVLVLPVLSTHRLHGLLYTFPKRYDRSAAESLRLLASHLAWVLARVDHLQELRSMAFVDELTQAYNRNYWMERFREELARAQRSCKPLSIILFDVDDFKACNDRFGHAVGDKVLAWIARTIRQSARNFDNVCRFGGEEFTVLLPEVDQRRAIAIAERIRRNVDIRSARSTQEGMIPMTISGGVATFPSNSTTPEGLLEVADQSMYRAKRMGKNRICFIKGERHKEND